MRNVVTNPSDASLVSDCERFLLLLAANLFICVAMPMMKPIRFPSLRRKKKLLRMKSRLQLEMFSVRTYTFFQRLDQSPTNNDYSRRLSQKAAYMADTPTRKRKDHVAQR